MSSFWVFWTVQTLGFLDCPVFGFSGLSRFWVFWTVQILGFLDTLGSAVQVQVREPLNRAL